MLNRPRVLAALAISVALVSAFASLAPTAEANEPAVFPPVRLLYGAVRLDRTQPYSCPGEGRGYAYGFVEVENLAPEKRVTVVYTTDWLDEWREVEASYVGPTHGNLEAWHFRTPVEEFLGSHPDQHCAGFRFAIRYEASGQVFWDNDGGRDYRVRTGGWPTESTFLLEGSAVALQYAGRSQGRVGGVVSVQNLGFEKQVDVLYSTDGGIEWTEVPARFWEIEYPTGAYESWQFDFPVSQSAPIVDVQFRYRVAGQEHVDDHFGEYYRLQGYTTSITGDL